LKQSTAVEVVEPRAHRRPPTTVIRGDQRNPGNRPGAWRGPQRPSRRVRAVVEGFGETGFVPNAGRLKWGSIRPAASRQGCYRASSWKLCMLHGDMFTEPERMKSQATKWLSELDTAQDCRPINRQNSPRSRLCSNLRSLRRLHGR
jgi:hypothetical protein